MEDKAAHEGEREPYEAPELTVLGTVEELTRANEVTTDATGAG